MESLQERVLAEGADCGIANDGDADRCLFVDERGQVLDGDHLMLINSLRMKKEGRLNHDMVVGTVMSNLGFGKALKEHGINTVSTKVGDRYVLEEMRKNGYSIGGEQSGHIIFSKHATTGDGILTSLKVMEVVLEKKQPLDKLASEVEIYPQVLKNVRVKDKKTAQDDEAVQAEVARVTRSLGSDGRILLRQSGTEPVVRVMVEAPDIQTCETYVDQVIQVMKDRGHCI